MSTTDKDFYGLTPHYQQLAFRLGTAARVAELGVAGGGSLELWQHLFPDSEVIVGVDHDPAATWPAGTIQLVADQADPGLPAALLSYDDTGYDLVVDDASHDPDLTRASFNNLWPIVRAGGSYVIEDWTARPTPIGWEFGMTRFVQSLPCLIPTRNENPNPQLDVDRIVYRFGMVVITKAQ